MDAVHSCRCCLRRAPDKDLTTPYTHLGNTEIYSDMIKQCFEIHLIVDSNDEVGICDVCVGQLRDASNFKLQVQRCQEELHAWLQGALRVKEEEPVSESAMENEDGTSEEPAFYGETEASGDASSDDDCMSLAGLVVSERARQQLGMACSVRLERLRGDEAPHASQTCLATSRHGPGLASRMKDMPGDTAGLRAEEQAYTFGKQYKRKSGISRHVQNHAPKKFSSEKSIKKEHKGEICDICNKKIAGKVNLIVHKRIHTGEKPYACEFCDKRFAQLSTLNAHTPQHTGEKRFSCNICNKRFTRSYTLRKHEKSHIGGGFRPFECEECHMKFKLLYYLKDHKRTHLKVRPFPCDKCDKTYLRKCDLAVHTETHTGNKRFPCEVCNKRFSYRRDLQRHEAIHTRRAHKATLEMHSTMHAEKLYTCDICYKPFSSKSSLIAHIELHMGT